jgi:coenzyme F420-0:L-glutamate ligase/coenzyme F420-1:gamma-L-glutamate ligase
MTTVDSIKKRRSIRKFAAKTVSKRTVLSILETAAWAPSAHNSQPWRFIIVEDPQIKRLLSERMAEAWAADLVRDGHNVNQKTRTDRIARFADAPVLIVACLTMEDLRKFPDVDRQGFERDLAVESLGAALQTLLLSAHSKGLGACWYCAPAFCKSVVREVLKVPKEVEPSAVVLAGYPAEKPTVERKPLNEYCYSNTWGRLLI